MNITAYLRVSTEKQDERSQRATCEALASSLGLAPVHFIAESVSGGVRWQDRQLSAWLESAKSGDVLLVSELSRVARSLTGIMSFLEAVSAKGLRVHVAQPRIDIDASIHSAILCFAFGIAAQLERDLIKSRTRAALAERKAAGVRLGRPRGSSSKSKLEPFREQLVALRAAKVSDAAIARMYKCSRHTVASFFANSEAA